MESLIFRRHNRYISNFDECWIPDFEGPDNLSGELGHKRSPEANTYFIGPLSRFKPNEKEVSQKLYDLCFIVSGPEPQRSIFERKIIAHVRDADNRSIIISGRPEKGFHSSSEGNVEIVAHMNDDDMHAVLSSSGLVICRPGYSSLMDLSVLGIPAAFVPTPGQTEQEYLARYHEEKGHFAYIKQKHFKPELLLNASKNYKGLSIRADKKLLEQRINNLVDLLDELK